jgi:hypothetical protein
MCTTANRRPSLCCCSCLLTLEMISINSKNSLICNYYESVAFGVLEILFIPLEISQFSPHPFPSYKSHFFPCHSTVLMSCFCPIKNETSKIIITG